MNKNISVHVYQSPMTHESRILKEVQSIHDQNTAIECVLVGTFSSNLLQAEILAPHLRVVRIKTFMQSFTGKLRKLWLIEWLLRVLTLRSLYQRCQVFHAHSVLVLPVAIILKCFYRFQVVYDCHELETETVGRKGPTQFLIRWVERVFIRYADLVIVVSPSILNHYRAAYPPLASKIFLIRNIPIRSLSNSGAQERLRGSLGIPSDSLVFLYQGVLGEGRGIQLLLDAWLQLKNPPYLVFMGYGSLESKIKSYCDRYNFFRFLPAVPPAEVQYYTAGASAGLCLIENASLSYFYSLPNKLFQYVHAGIPVVVSNFPDMAQFVEEHSCGWISDTTVDALASIVAGIDSKELVKKSEGAQSAGASLDWTSEAEPLRRFYAFEIK